jgi:hypothetical protein
VNRVSRRRSPSFAAKIMGVYGSAQVALEACRLILDR